MKHTDMNIRKLLLYVVMSVSLLGCISSKVFAGTSNLPNGDTVEEQATFCDPVDIVAPYTHWVPCNPGGASGSVTAAGTNGTLSQAVQGINGGVPVPVSSPSANGTDASGSAPSALTILSTFTVTQPGEYYVQNQSAGTLQVIFDNGSGGAVSIQLLAPGAGAGQQGADTTPPMPWFTGRIQVAGASGAQFMARHN